MKAVFTLLLALFISGLQAQESSHQSVLTAPNSWTSELIPFPMGFAPSLDYQGFEDIRFSKGWADSTANDYFTYTFTWYLDKNPDITAAGLQNDMKAYFDGLMSAVSERNDLPKTKAVFEKTAEGAFQGQVTIYEAFFTKRQVLLNAIVKANHCQTSRKYIVRFEFSPQAIDSTVWKAFKEVKLNVNCN